MLNIIWYDLLYCLGIPVPTVVNVTVMDRALLKIEWQPVNSGDHYLVLCGPYRTMASTTLLIIPISVCANNNTVIVMVVNECDQESSPAHDQFEMPVTMEETTGSTG